MVPQSVPGDVSEVVQSHLLPSSQQMQRILSQIHPAFGNNECPVVTLREPSRQREA